MGDHQVKAWKEAGLMRSSLVQMKLATIEARRILRKLGSLQEADLLAVEQGLKVAIGMQ